MRGAVYGLDNSINAAGRTVAPMLGAAIATGWGYPAVFVATGVGVSGRHPVSHLGLTALQDHRRIKGRKTWTSPPSA